VIYVGSNIPLCEYILALNNHNEEVGMKKLAAAVVILSSLSGSSVWAHEAGEFFIRAGSATVRPTEGAGGTLGSLGALTSAIIRNWV
jgi:outer membrane protein